MSQPVDLAAAVEQALRAPSVHNTQPWVWRIRPEPQPGAVELHADWSRQLHATDPDRRDLVLSCGAALHHLRVVLAAQGRAVVVDRLPDPENSGHLATLTPCPGEADRADAALRPAVERRRTDRRRMSHEPVAPQHLDTLAGQARRTGAALHPVRGPARRARLLEILTDAARDQEQVPGYRAELETWTHRYAGARDGVPASSVAPPSVGLVGPSPLRWFPPGRLVQPHLPPGHGRDADAADLLVITTDGDGVDDRVHAGEATSAVLLAATVLGLATTPLSQGLESGPHRQAIRRDVLGVGAQPQLIVRVGWPAAGAAELPATPRRELRSVLLVR